MSNHLESIQELNASVATSVDGIVTKVLETVSGPFESITLPQVPEQLAGFVTPLKEAAAKAKDSAPSMPELPEQVQGFVKPWLDVFAPVVAKAEQAFAA